MEYIFDSSFYYDQQMHNYFTNYHSYMFQHYRIILRELVINTLPSYTSISNAAVCNTVYYLQLTVKILTF